MSVQLPVNYALSLEEATNIIKEPAFEKLESNIISFCLSQVIKSTRLKAKTKFEIVHDLLQKQGIIQIYKLFNSSKVADHRKLAGRLLCEVCYKSQESQTFICEAVECNDFPLIPGSKVCLNKTIPPLIKQKLNQDQEFLKFLVRSQKQPIEEQRYWSFPEFKELIKFTTKSDIRKSLSPGQCDCRPSQPCTCSERR